MAGSQEVNKALNQKQTQELSSRLGLPLKWGLRVRGFLSELQAGVVFVLRLSLAEWSLNLHCVCLVSAFLC